jgi:CheY-like chemotaxis protein
MRALLVDDDKEFLDLYKRLLSEFSWDVSVADGIRKADEYLSTLPFDVIVIDRQMRNPDTDLIDVRTGDRFLERTVEKYPSVCAVMMTANSDVESAKQTTRYGAWEYFQKSTLPGQLVESAVRGVRSLRFSATRRQIETAASHDRLLALLQQIIDPQRDQLHFLILEKRNDSVLLRAADSKLFTGLQFLRCEDSQLREFPSVATLIQDSTIQSDLKLEGGEMLFSSPVKSDAVLVPLFQSNEDSRTQRIICIISAGQNCKLDHRDRVVLRDFGASLADAYRHIEHGEQVRMRTSAEGADFIATSANDIWDLVCSAQTRVDSVVSDPTAIESLGEQTLQTLKSAERFLTNAVDFIRYFRRPLDAFEVVAEPCDPVESLATTLQRLRMEHQQEAELDFSLPHLEPPVRLECTAEFIRSAISCLIQNSIDSINARRRNEPRFNHGSVKLRLSVSPTRSAILISIIDNGIGIEHTNVPRLFQRGFTTKRLTLESTRTLGLHRIRKVVESFGGHFEGGPGLKGGADFTMVLPTA